MSSNKHLADIFIKPLDERQFYELRNELNIIDSRKWIKMLHIMSINTPLIMNMNFNWYNFTLLYFTYAKFQFFDIQPHDIKSLSAYILQVFTTCIHTFRGRIFYGLKL